MNSKYKNKEDNVLISSREFKEMAKLNFPGGLLISKLVVRLLRFNRLNKMHVEYRGPGGLDFIVYASETLGLKYEINEDELKHIPETGAFVTISNHPYGGADGIGLHKTMLPLRPHFKTLSNFMMSRLTHMTQNFIALDPFSEGGSSSVNFAGIKEAMRHLQNGEPLGIFPAGEVASYNNDYEGISDKKWNRSVMRMIQKAEVPVIPVYFHGTNSRMFHLLGRIHPVLRTAKIPSELLNKRRTVIKMTIGKAIDVPTQKQYANINDYISFIREKTYALKDIVMEPVSNHAGLKGKMNCEEMEKIAPAPDRKLLLKDIEYLKSNNKSIIKKDFYEVFCADSMDIPILMYEIGRQREITFRKVGEGSNRRLDIDKFDERYKQLIMWDNDKGSLVGAYRIGIGAELIHDQGVKGFYSHTLFAYKPRMRGMLSNSMELGRSFVVEEYQRKALPLFLLWAGIFEIAAKCPHCRYLIGPVSISNEFSKEEKDRMVSFIRQFYSISGLAKMLRPVMPYKTEKDFVFEHGADLRKIDLPVLLKKYLQVNGKIAAFNVDPDFNYTLDGLVVLDFNEIPESFVRRFKDVKDSDENLKNADLLASPEAEVNEVF